MNVKNDKWDGCDDNKINSDVDFFLGKTLEMYNVIMLVISLFNDKNKYYP